MKISIDTKEDSPEEIRKLIRMLLALVGDSPDYGSQRSPPATGEGLFDMFGSPESSTAEQQRDLFSEPKSTSVDWAQSQQRLGKGQSKTEQQESGMDINDFIDHADESSSQKSGTDDDENFKVVPY